MNGVVRMQEPWVLHGRHTEAVHEATRVGKIIEVLPLAIRSA